MQADKVVKSLKGKILPKLSKIPNASQLVEMYVAAMRMGIDENEIVDTVSRIRPSVLEQIDWDAVIPYTNHKTGRRGSATLKTLMSYDKEHDGYKAAIEYVHSHQVLPKKAKKPLRYNIFDDPAEPSSDTNTGKLESKIVDLQKDKIRQRKQPLKDVDTRKQTAFNRGAMLSSDDYYSKAKQAKALIHDSVVTFDEDLKRKTRVPVRYWDFLERMMNSKLTSETKSLTYITGEHGGAGTIISQAGELMSLISSTMTKTDSEKFFQHIEHTVGGVDDDERIIKTEWIHAAKMNRRAIHNDIKMRFGSNAKIDSASWDEHEGIADIGMNPKFKAKSADIFIKVKDESGKYHCRQVSLKKELSTKSTKFLSSGVQQFKEWDDTIPDSAMPDAYAEKLNKDLSSFWKKHGKDIIQQYRESKDMFPRMHAVIQEKNVKLNDLFRGGSRDIKRTIFRAMEDMAERNPEMQAKVTAIRNRSWKYAAHITGLIEKHPKVKAAILTKLQHEFPILSAYMDEESIAFGENVLNVDVLTKIFGSKNPDAYTENLSVVKAKSGRTYLRYMGENGKRLNIAVVSIYENGVGYGAKYNFDLEIAPDFVKAVRDANTSLFKK